MSSTEPSPARLGGAGPFPTARRLLLATRPMFFSASVLPVALGSVAGYRTAGDFAAWPAASALLAVVLVHAGVNVLNDVYDHLQGGDDINTGRIYPFTGGSRFIQNDVMSAAQLSRWGWLLLALGAAAGTLVVFERGAGVLVFGVAGLALGVAYSMPPPRLSDRGLGELAVGLGFGVVPVTGAAWLQSGMIDTLSLLLSLAMAGWVANILLVNGFPDARADASTGKRTLVVRLGARRAWHLYVAINVAAAGAVTTGVAADLLPPAALAVPIVTVATAALAARAPADSPDSRLALTAAIKATLLIHALGALSLAIVVLTA